MLYETLIRKEPIFTDFVQDIKNGSRSHMHGLTDSSACRWEQLRLWEGKELPSEYITSSQRAWKLTWASFVLKASLLPPAPLSSLSQEAPQSISTCLENSTARLVGKQQYETLFMMKTCPCEAQKNRWVGESVLRRDRDIGMDCLSSNKMQGLTPC